MKTKQRKLAAVCLLLAVAAVAAVPAMASYYTYLHPFDVEHDQCTNGCMYTDHYGNGPGSWEIGIIGGCPAGHVNVNAGVNFQAVPEPDAISPWWIGNAGDDPSSGWLYTIGTCGDYAFYTQGQWDYEQDCDFEEEYLEEPTPGTC